MTGDVVNGVSACVVLVVGTEMMYILLSTVSALPSSGHLMVGLTWLGWDILICTTGEKVVPTASLSGPGAGLDPPSDQVGAVVLLYVVAGGVAALQ